MAVARDVRTAGAFPTRIAAIKTLVGDAEDR
jgi:hypothetical protein